MMKGGCLMDSLRSLNNALAYIEEHLTEEIDYSEISKIAYCSEYHFKRMFSFLAGISLSEYIRRRRLTLAALDLKDTDLRIIDVAVKYGYNSADSFSRAFHSLHGILPSEARSENTQLKAYPRMTFQLSIKGGCEMRYRIVEKGPFKLVGFKKRVPIIFEGVNPEIIKMTKLLTMDVINQLKAISNVEPKGIISASTNFSEGRMGEKGELDHYIGVATLSNETADFDVLKLMPVPGLYLNRLAHFRKHFKMCGVGYIQNGFHLQDTRRLKALRFYGMIVQTQEIQIIEAKSGFQ